MEIQIFAACPCRIRLYVFLRFLSLVTVAGLQGRQPPGDVVGVQIPDETPKAPSPGEGLEQQLLDNPDFMDYISPKDGSDGGEGKPNLRDGKGPVRNSKSVEYFKANAGLKLLDRKKYPYARCMDGSPGGYYFKPASTERGKSNWIIHLQGGGECAELDRCNILKLTNLGSSWMFPARHSFFGDAVDIRVAEEGTMILANYQVMMDCRKNQNPDFYDWNMVFVPYCSQDLWLGKRKQASDQTHFVYYAGAHIYQAVIDTLDEELGMTAAQGIVLTGDSAGGYGVYTHLDTLAESHPNSKVVGSSVGGMWTYAHPFKGAGHTQTIFSDFRERSWPTMMRLWAAELREDCERDHVRKADCLVQCSSQPYPWTYIKNKLFIVEAQTDNVLATYHNWIPQPPTRLDGMHDPRLYAPDKRRFLTEFGQNMTTCLRTGLKSLEEKQKNGTIGVFSPACFAHTNFENNIKIEGRSYLEAFGDFYFERGPTPLLMEEGFLSNPTCGSEYFNVMI